jgi:polar amino acid transport system substrate-binding protein
MKYLAFPQRAQKLSLAAAGLVAALSLSACGADAGTAASAPAAAADPQIQALVPQEFRDAGSIEIAVDNAYPPMNFMQDDRMVGIEPEMWKAAGDLMGLEVKPTVVAFDSIVPALKSGRYDASFAGFWITDERVKEVDMVSFFQSGSQYLVRPDDAKGPINAFDDLCGRTVALHSGSYEMTYAENANKTCAEEGREPVVIQGYKSQDQATLAVTSGRADTTGMGAEVAGYVAQLSNGKLKTAGEVFHQVEGGIALPQGSDLAPAFQAAFAKLIETPRYKEIFAQWGLESAMIAESTSHTAK